MTNVHQGARSPHIDALRALAMLAVIGIHAKLLPLGWIGVWLFYVISGYVVTASVIARQHGDRGGESYARFVQRRSARILPLYAAYVGTGLLVAAVAGTSPSLVDVASFALFFNNVAMAMGEGRISGWPSGHLWTLSVEMQFYLVYGAALCLMSRATVRAGLIAFLLIAPIGRAIVSAWLAAEGVMPLDAAFAIYVAPVLHFDVFAMGALLAMLQAEGRLAAYAPRIAVAGGALLAAYVLAYVGVNAVARDARGLDMMRDVISGILVGEGREVFLYSAVGAAASGVVALAATNHHWLPTGLAWRPLVWIGERSYGGYVYHQLGLMSATALLGSAGIVVRGGGVDARLMQFAIGLAITLMLAALSFRFFEQPAGRWIMRARLPVSVPAAHRGEARLSGDRR